MVGRVGTLVVLGVLLALSNVYAELLAGAAKRDIVPPFPTHMGGFGDRLSFFEGVHDPIYARALVVDDGTTVVAIVGSGLMSVDAKLVAKVRERVERDTGVPGANVMVACAHNHSAPSYYQYEDPKDQTRVEDVCAERFAEAVVEAYRTRGPAKLGFGAGAVRGATRNRQQDNEEVIDTQVGVLRVE